VWWGVVVVVLVVFFLFFLCLCFSGCVVVVCVVCCSYKLQGKECELFVATDVATGERVTVKPVAVCAGYSYDVLLILDAVTGKGMWYDFDGRWYIDSESECVHCCAERVEGVFGEDEDEWEACANDFLADYGFRLGAFDEVLGDRYELVEV
jgi:hypothetical protein